MFSSETALWKLANARDELDDWLPYAEDLINKWSNQSSDQIEYSSAFQISLAALLLKDNLLPASARSAFADLMLKAMYEADRDKQRIKCLHIEPPKPGRKNNRDEIAARYFEVHSLIEDGMACSDAYSKVAEKYFKSPDTVRRDYERLIKRSRKKNRLGKSISEFPGDSL